MANFSYPQPSIQTWSHTAWAKKFIKLKQTLGQPNITIHEPSEGQMGKLKPRVSKWSKEEVIAARFLTSRHTFAPLSRLGLKRVLVSPVDSSTVTVKTRNLGAYSSHCTASIPALLGPWRLLPRPVVLCLKLTPGPPPPPKGWTLEAASIESPGWGRAEDSLTQSLMEEPSQAGGCSSARTDKLVPLCHFVTWESFFFRICQGSARGPENTAITCSINISSLIDV